MKQQGQCIKCTKATC